MLDQLCVTVVPSVKQYGDTEKFPRVPFLEAIERYQRPHLLQALAVGGEEPDSQERLTLDTAAALSCEMRIVIVDADRDKVMVDGERHKDPWPLTNAEETEGVRPEHCSAATGAARRLRKKCTKRGLAAPIVWATTHGLRLVWVPKEPIPFESWRLYFATLQDTYDPVVNATRTKRCTISIDKSTCDAVRLMYCPQDGVEIIGLREEEGDYRLSIPIPEPETREPFDPSSFVITCADEPKLRDMEAKVSRFAAALSMAPVGQRHARLIRYARAIGGNLTFYGLEDEPYVSTLVRGAVASGKATSEAARTVACGIAHGRRYPCALEGMIQRRTMILHGAGNSILLRSANGVYEWSASRSLAGDIRTEYPGLAAQTQYMTNSGRMKDLLPQELMERFGLRMDKIVLSYAGEAAVEWANAARTIVNLKQRVVRIHPRLKPVRHPEVMEWFDSMLGGEPHHLQLLLDWLATAPKDLSRPMPALFLVGPSGTGKSLIAVGLAAMWGSTLVEYLRILDGFNSDLAECPVVWWEECAKVAGKNSQDYRAFISQTSRTISTKFRPNATLLGCPRLLGSANEFSDIPLTLEQSRTLDGEEAISERACVVKISRDAKDWLEERGGFALTYDWVNYEDGSPGKIPQTLQWLRENHEVVNTHSRFQVKAPRDVWATSQVQRQGIQRDILIQICTDVLQAEGPARAGNPIVKGSSVYVEEIKGVDMIVKRAREVRKGFALGTKLTPITPESVRNVLSKHSSHESTRTGRPPRSMVERVRGRFYCLSGVALLDIAASSLVVDPDALAAKLGLKEPE